MEAQQQGFTIQINYDEESKEKGLIKIIPEEGIKEIVLESDAVLDLIGRNIQGKGIAIYLREVDRNEIWMMKVLRNVRFKADKDYVAGEEIVLGIEHPYPALLYAAEMTYLKAAEENKFEAISTEALSDNMKELAQKNVPFLNHFNALLNAGSEEPTKKVDEPMIEPEETTV